MPNHMCALIIVSFNLIGLFFFPLEGDYEGLFLRPIKGGNKPIIAKLETKYPVYLIMKLLLLQFRGFE